MAARFYNAHAHCFTLDHVPEYVFGKVVPVSRLLSRKWFIRLVQVTPVTGRFTFLGSLLRGVVSLLLGFDKAAVIRYLNLVRYGHTEKQADVIRQMREYYPRSTGLVFLSMDLEYMGAGRPRKPYAEQLAELAALQTDPDSNGLIFPFACCDPRRLAPQTPREKAVEQVFVGDACWSALTHFVEKGQVRGFKIYPALGFFPFDQRLRRMWDLALAQNLPVMAHSETGIVHLHYRPSAAERFHPCLRQTLPDLKPAKLQAYFSHPLNYECLLNRDLLKIAWGEDAPDYRNLKLCFGHWGGQTNWHDYLDDAWSDVSIRRREGRPPALELGNWHLDPREQYRNFSWFSIICDLMRNYPNVYADISYTLSDLSLLPLLKMMLEADATIRERVLFGTDFYMVSTAITERAYAIQVRAYLGEALFHQIATVNTERYLGIASGQEYAEGFPGRQHRQMLFPAENGPVR